MMIRRPWRPGLSQEWTALSARPSGRSSASASVHASIAARAGPAPLRAHTGDRVGMNEVGGWVDLHGSCSRNHGSSGDAASKQDKNSSSWTTEMNWTPKEYVSPPLKKDFSFRGSLFCVFYMITRTNIVTTGGAPAPYSCVLQIWSNLVWNLNLLQIIHISEVLFLYYWSFPYFPWVFPHLLSYLFDSCGRGRR